MSRNKAGSARHKARFVDAQCRERVRQLVCALRTLPHQHLEIGGRHVELARNPLQLARISCEFRQLVQLPTLLEPVAKQIDDFRDKCIRFTLGCCHCTLQLCDRLRWRSVPARQ